MPPMDVGNYLDLLMRQGLIRSVEALTQYQTIL
jgi:hypothetical protein